MNTMRNCPGCQKPLEADAPDGLCPKCLLKAGLGTGADIGLDSQSQAEGGKVPFVAPTPDELAKPFPQLEILGFVGQGGMGAVYRARQKALDRVVALKILPPGIGKDPAFAERFTREARAMARLNHPGIVTLYEFGQADGLFFFLMEFVDGVNLRQLLEAGRLSPREALAIVPQICDALQYAHDQGIVHRDIKPENILLDRQGRVKVADFGLAKLVGVGEEPSAAGGIVAGSVVLTEVGKVMGTPQYMAPEQREHPAEVDHRVDIYSVGVVFYQMLTGELPGRPIEPPSRKLQVDVRLDEVVLRALATEPERRYQQVSQMKSAVETIATTPHPRNASAPAAPAGASHTNAQPSAGRLSLWCRIVGIALNGTFTSPLAIKLVNISALGFLGALAFLGFVPLPGMHRCVGFAGFCGFFGLIGVAVIIELSSQRKAKKAAGNPPNSRPSRPTCSSPRQEPQAGAPSPRLLKGDVGFVTTPEQLGTFEGQLFLWHRRSQLLLDERQLTVSRAGAFTVIPLAAIRDLSIGHYGRVMHPAGLDFISVTYDADGQTQRLYFSPYESWFGLPSNFNRIVAEWFNAIRAAVLAATGREPGNTPANQLGVPSASKALYALLLAPVVLCGIFLLAGVLAGAVMRQHAGDAATHSFLGGWYVIILGVLGFGFLALALRRLFGGPRKPAAPPHLSRMAVVALLLSLGGCLLSLLLGLVLFQSWGWVFGSFFAIETAALILGIVAWDKRTGKAAVILSFALMLAWIPGTLTHMAQVAPNLLPKGSLRSRAATANFVAKLSQGEVELVGISFHPSASQPWWEPNGSPLKTAPYDFLGASVADEKGQVTREIAVQLRHLSAAPVDVQWRFDPPCDSSGGGMPTRLSAQIADLRAIAVRVPAAIPTITVLVGVATGQRQTGSGSRATSEWVEFRDVALYPKQPLAGPNATTFSPSIKNAISGVQCDSSKATIPYEIDDAHELFLFVGTGSLGWSAWYTGTTSAIATVEASDQIKMEDGSLGRGFIFQAKGSLAYVAITPDGPVPFGELVFRETANVTEKDGTFTFADVRQADGTLIPVSIRVRPVSGKSRGSQSPGTVAEPPKLCFLAWQDENPSWRDWKAWRPNGEPADTAEEQGLLLHHPPTRIDLSATKEGGGVRVLFVWFSHPHIERRSYAEMTMADSTGRTISPCPDGYGGGVYPVEASEGELGWVVRWFAPARDATLPSTVNLTLKYSLGDWQFPLVVTREMFGGTMETEWGNIPGAGETLDGKAFVSLVRDTAKGRDLHVDFAAETTDGRLIEPSGTLESGPPEMRHGRFQFDAPLRQIKEFRLRTCPLRVVEYRNVSLQTGHSTEVQVSPVSSSQSAAPPQTNASRTFSLRYTLASEIADDLRQILLGRFGMEARPAPDNMQLTVTAPPDVLNRVSTFVAVNDWPDRIARGPDLYYPRENVQSAARSFFYACSIEDTEGVALMLSPGLLAELNGTSLTAHGVLGEEKDAELVRQLRGNWQGKEAAVQEVIQAWNRFPLRWLRAEPGIAIGFGLRYFASAAFEGAPEERTQLSFIPDRAGGTNGPLMIDTLPPWLTASPGRKATRTKGSQTNGDMYSGVSGHAFFCQGKPREGLGGCEQGWKVEDGCLVNTGDGAHISTKMRFAKEDLVVSASLSLDEVNDAGMALTFGDGYAFEFGRTDQRFIVSGPAPLRTYQHSSAASIITPGKPLLFVAQRRGPLMDFLINGTLVHSVQYEGEMGAVGFTPKKGAIRIRSFGVSQMWPFPTQ